MTIRTHFSELDISSPDSMTRFLREFFNFCMLIKEFASLYKKPFDEARFNSLYANIYPIAPVSCMTLFRRAIQADNDALFDAFLKNGFNVNDDLTFYNTPLYYSMLRQKPYFTLKLIQYGADVNQLSRGIVKGEMPLEFAAHKGLNEEFNELIRAGADPLYISCIDGTNNLHHVGKLSGLEWVSYLVDKGVDINLLDFGDYFHPEYGGHSPIYAAAAAGRQDGVKQMLKYGADINLQNKQGNTMLHIAVINTALEAVQILVEHGVDQTLKNNEGVTAAELSQVKYERSLKNMDHNSRTVVKKIKKINEILLVPSVNASLSDRDVLDAPVHSPSYSFLLNLGASVASLGSLACFVLAGVAIAGLIALSSTGLGFVIGAGVISTGLATYGFYKANKTMKPPISNAQALHLMALS